MEFISVPRKLLIFAYEHAASVDLVGTGSAPPKDEERKHYEQVWQLEELLRIPADERRGVEPAEPALLKLTGSQQQVYKALSNTFEYPDTITKRAAISTSYPRETAAKYCIELVKLGLAEKGGSGKFPMWRKAQSQNG